MTETNLFELQHRRQAGRASCATAAINSIALTEDALAGAYGRRSSFPRSKHVFIKSSSSWWSP